MTKTTSTMKGNSILGPIGMILAIGMFAAYLLMRAGFNVDCPGCEGPANQIRDGGGQIIDQLDNVQIEIAPETTIVVPPAVAP